MTMGDKVAKAITAVENFILSMLKMLQARMILVAEIRGERAFFYFDFSIFETNIKTYFQRIIHAIA